MAMVTSRWYSGLSLTANQCQLLTFLSFITGAHGGGGGNIFQLGDFVQDDPIGTFLMLFGVVLFTIFIEHYLHKAQREIKNRHVLHLMNLVLRELTMMGIISLVLVFLAAVLSAYGNIVALFDWAHMVLFIMAMSFIIFVASFIGSVSRIWRKWSLSEKKLDNIITTISLLCRALHQLTARVYFYKWILYYQQKRLLRRGGLLPPIEISDQLVEQRLNHLRKQSSNVASEITKMASWEKSDKCSETSEIAENEAMAKFLAARHQKYFFFAFIKFKRQVATIHPDFIDISFCRYLKKCQRQHLQALIEIHWTGWVSILILQGLNSVRVMVFKAILHESHTALAMVVFIISIGYLPVVFFCVIWAWVKRNFEQYCSEGLPEEERDVSSLVRDLCGSMGVEAKVASIKLLMGDEILGGAAQPDFVEHERYFFFHSVQRTFQLLQTNLLCTVFFLSLVLLSIFKEAKVSAWYYTILLVALCMGPPIIIIAGFPKVVQHLTILSSTGNMINHEILQEIAYKDNQESSDESDVDPFDPPEEKHDHGHGDHSPGHGMSPGALAFMQKDKISKAVKRMARGYIPEETNKAKSRRKSLMLAYRQSRRQQSALSDAPESDQKRRSHRDSSDLEKVDHVDRSEKRRSRPGSGVSVRLPPGDAGLGPEDRHDSDLSQKKANRRSSPSEVAHNNGEQAPAVKRHDTVQSLMRHDTANTLRRQATVNLALNAIPNPSQQAQPGSARSSFASLADRHQRNSPPSAKSSFHGLDGHPALSPDDSVSVVAGGLSAMLAALPVVNDLGNNRSWRSPASLVAHSPTSFGSSAQSSSPPWVASTVSSPNGDPIVSHSSRGEKLIGKDKPQRSASPERRRDQSPEQRRRSDQFDQRRRSYQSPTGKTSLVQGTTTTTGKVSSGSNGGVSPPAPTSSNRRSKRLSAGMTSPRSLSPRSEKLQPSTLVPQIPPPPPPLSPPTQQQTVAQALKVKIGDRGEVDKSDQDVMRKNLLKKLTIYTESAIAASRAASPSRISPAASGIAYAQGLSPRPGSPTRSSLLPRPLPPPNSTVFTPLIELDDQREIDTESLASTVVRRIDRWRNEVPHPTTKRRQSLEAVAPHAIKSQTKPPFRSFTPGRSRPQRSPDYNRGGRSKRADH